MGSLERLVALLIITMCTSVTMSLAQNVIATPNLDNQNTTVVIYNDLGDDLPLRFHCQSRDVDLGSQHLAAGGSWSFEFKPSASGDTIYACLFGWKLEFHYFRIYRQDRDKESSLHGCTRCEWKIHKDGPCQLNNVTKMIDHCPPWDSSQFSKNNLPLFI
ncbi:putative S-protein [Cardamine amara subsp. amara]|uniref:S-protein homolog n=1 Tax=Cardamine amara subsp. amara TaxID=228776 RepID=A0ABD1C2M3_CARAN